MLVTLLIATNAITALTGVLLYLRLREKTKMLNRFTHDLLEAWKRHRHK